MVTRRGAARETRTSGEGRAGRGAGTAVGYLTREQTDGGTWISVPKKDD